MGQVAQHALFFVTSVRLGARRGGGVSWSRGPFGQ